MNDLLGKDTETWSIIVVVSVSDVSVCLQRLYLMSSGASLTC